MKKSPEILLLLLTFAVVFSISNKTIDGQISLFLTISYNIMNLDKYRIVNGHCIIPEGVTEIEFCAFKDCTKLKSVEIPDSVIKIGDCAFFGCINLTKVQISKYVKTIGGHAFANCTSLKNISIPNSVIKINSLAFYGCTGLTSIYIPDSVTWIGICPFAGCISLTSLCIAKDNPNYFSENNVIYKKDKTLLVCCACSKQGTYKILDSVTSIGSSAFAGCTGITKIILPNSVTEIRDCAFKGCSSLTDIEISNSITKIGNSAFSGCIYEA